MMTAKEREYVLTEFVQTRELVKDTFQGLSSQQFLYRPDANVWSVADNLEHLIVVEKRVLSRIEALLREPPSLSKRAALTDERVVDLITNVVDRMQAPLPVVPTSQWPPEQLVPEFEKARQQTHEFAAAADGDLRRRFITHYLYGELDCYQWLVLLSAHCRRHCSQSEQVKASPGYPR
jgi:DinB superfamily